jgi:hypothetical protein
LELVARVIERCEPPRADGPGHSPAETVRVLATLRRFLCEDTPWRGLRATETNASGSTLRRQLADWARTGALRHMHSMLVGILCSQPDTARDLKYISNRIRNRFNREHRIAAPMSKLGSQPLGN